MRLEMILCIFGRICTTGNALVRLIFGRVLIRKMYHFLGSRPDEASSNSYINERFPNFGCIDQRIWQNPDILTPLIKIWAHLTIPSER